MNSAPSSISLTRVEVPDYHFGHRGKVYRSDKAAPGEASAFCTILYDLDLVDGVTDTSFSSAQNGYPDSPLQLDESTRIDLPWLERTQAVIGDQYDADGQVFGASPRGALQRVLQRYDAVGITPVLGYEFEFWIFHDDDRGRPDGEIEPLGRLISAYSLGRMAGASSLFLEFVDRMSQIGIPIEMIHSEQGPGLFEFTLSPLPALQAADAATRAKTYMRELCAERGLAASFMAKPFGAESGAGGHVHSSLVSDGRNIFADAPGVLSQTAKHYLAGLLTTMPDFMGLFAPYVNSYKRIDPTQFVADRPSWAVDDRSTTCRTLLASTKAARVEHRVPGADTSPYFSAAAILAGGILGIEQQLDLDEAVERAVKLPTSLSEAAERFASSEIAQQVFDPKFIEAVSTGQRTEARDYENWLRTNITSWERSRHLERH